MAIHANPLEVLLALRSASYHETHQEEKTPFLKSIQIVSAAYKFLLFIDCHHEMEAMLADHGIAVRILSGQEYQDGPLSDQDRAFVEREYGTAALPYDQIGTLKELVYVLYDEAISKRCEICEKMKIRKNAKKVVMAELDIESQEFNRLHQLTALAVEDTDRTAVQAVQARVKINTSLSNFNLGLRALSKHDGIRNHL
jgi:hypothetical protein